VSRFLGPATILLPPGERVNTPALAVDLNPGVIADSSQVLGQTQCLFGSSGRIFVGPLGPSAFTIVLTGRTMALRQRVRNRRPMKTASAPLQRTVASGRNSFFS
jgi:hypothetical protein